MGAGRGARLPFAAAAVVGVGARSLSSQHMAAYDAHLAEFGISRVGDAVGYEHRLDLFARRLREIAEHNADPERTWRMGRNHMSDWTHEEFTGLLGHRPLLSGRAHEFAPPVPRLSSFLETRSLAGVASRRNAAAASDVWRDSVDWSQDHPEIGDHVQNQGACGGCWAAAAVGAMHANALIQKVNYPEDASFEYLISCVPNPHHCGGKGGCKGHTAEGAMQFMSEHGVPLAKDFQGYLSRADGETPPCDKTAKFAYRTDGYTRLPSNQYAPVMSALNQGAVVMSVDSTTWSAYAGGVMQCGEGGSNKITNHAVLGVGYGTDGQTGLPYWLIRNSWSPSWGEKGFIRLRRSDGNCGLDTKPREGTACDGAPNVLMSCGDCGVLMDSAVPGPVVPLVH